MKEFDFKVGDLVYCYNDKISIDYICIRDDNEIRRINLPGTEVIINKKGNYYIINDIYEYNNVVENLPNTAIIVSCEKYRRKYANHGMERDSCWLRVGQLPQLNISSDDYFYNYFLSKKEHRKLKLEKLNDRI